jgi:hypothetical protein
MDEYQEEEKKKRKKVKKEKGIPIGGQIGPP